MEADLGIVLRGVGGIYDVQDNTGKIIRCYPRGRIKQQDLVILAGDKVRYTIINGNEGVIEAVLPRSTVLPRPAVANIEQLIVVSACASPKPQPVFIDRLLILAESRGIHPLICLNKIDLLSESVPEELSATYKKGGYQVARMFSKNWCRTRRIARMSSRKDK